MNLREKSEEVLNTTLEGLWALSVELTSPLTGLTKSYKGQVMFSYMLDNPEGGEPLVVEQPAVVLRISSLDEVPQANENWFIRIPNAPSESAPLENYALDGSRAPRNDGSIGLITLYLIRIDQE